MTTTTIERPHGKDRYVNDNCRCLTCRIDASRDRAHVVQLKQAGKWAPWVDADQVRAHIAQLMAAGYTEGIIAGVAGVSHGTLRLLRGADGKTPTRSVRRDTARRILSVTVADLLAARRQLKPSVGTVRRLQALCAVGWSLSVQARRLGVGQRRISVLVQQPWVQQTTAVRVRRLYDELSMVAPPRGQSAGRARSDAQRKGWFPPLAWDDDTIDDPAAVPCLMPPVDGSDPAADEWEIQHWAAGHTATLTRTDEVEVVRRLLADDLSHTEIAARLGRSLSWVGAARRGIEDSAVLAMTTGEKR